MKAIFYHLSSGASGLFLLALAVFMPALVQAQPANDGQSVKALTTNASGALVVLRGSGLFALEGQTAVEMPLPPSDSGSQPNTLAKGADSSLYLAGPGLGIWRYDNANESWQPLNDTLPDLGITAIAAHATQPDTLYAYLGDDGMFRSRDGGEGWAPESRCRRSCTRICRAAWRVAGFSLVPPAVFHVPWTVSASGAMPASCGALLPPLITIRRPRKTSMP